jgi:hypothetical protein
MSEEEFFSASEFLKLVAPRLIDDLVAHDEIRKFTTNPDVIGAYIESAVRELVRRYVHPLRVSTGAVIDAAAPKAARDIPQMDTIIWTPSPAPAIFTAGDFALVPRSSALGLLEIKLSAYKVGKLRERLRSTFVHKYTADAMAGEKERFGGTPPLPALGVVCVSYEKQSKKSLQELRSQGSVTLLFEQRGTTFQPQEEDIYRLVNFLAFIRWRAKVHEGELRINTDVLRK